MMTIEEIESACEASTSQALDFVGGHGERPELPLHEMFYLHGFPVEVFTNSPRVLEIAAELWGMFEKAHSTEPTRIYVNVTEGGSAECPSPPQYRFHWPLLLTFADVDNFMIAELDHNYTHIEVTSQAMRHKLFVGALFLAAAPGVHLAVRHITPVHGACVTLDGLGVMLCGDSGAGKTTLSYACARAGWTYICDDASYLLNSGTDRTVMGACNQVRFRPPAVELFPELRGQDITPRLVGKPSIEMPTTFFPKMTCAPSAQVDFIVFLNRRSAGPPELRSYRKDVARQSMRQTLYGTPKSLAVSYEVIERLLALDIYELRYTDLDWAVDRLQRMVREGR